MTRNNVLRPHEESEHLPLSLKVLLAIDLILVTAIVLVSICRML